MTDEQALERLGKLQRALSQLHNNRAVAWQAWHQAKYRAVADGVQRGVSVTQARELADSSVVDLKNNLVGIEGEIAGYQEERDHLRFVMDHK